MGNKKIQGTVAAACIQMEPFTKYYHFREVTKMVMTHLSFFI